MHVHRLHVVEQARDLGQEVAALLALTRRRVEPYLRPDRVVQLHGVQPKVQPRNSEPHALPFAAQHEQVLREGERQVARECGREPRVDRADRVLLQRALLECEAIQPAEPRRVLGFLAERLDTHREALAQRVKAPRDRRQRIRDRQRAVQLAQVVHAARELGEPRER